jgi:hypothetical protein
VILDCAPVFKQLVSDSVGPHQSQPKADQPPAEPSSGSRLWELSYTGSNLPPLAILIVPEDYRYHAASKVIGSQIHWLSLFACEPYGGSRRRRPSNHSTAELSILIRDGIAANRTMWDLANPHQG